MSKYPEHEKLAKVKQQSQAIGEFLLARSSEPEPRMPKKLMPDHASTEEVLAEYFEIDRRKLGCEQRAMLSRMWETGVLTWTFTAT